MSDTTETIEIPRLKAKYQDEIRDQLQALIRQEGTPLPLAAYAEETLG